VVYSSFPEEAHDCDPARKRGIVTLDGGNTVRVKSQEEGDAQDEALAGICCSAGGNQFYSNVLARGRGEARGGLGEGYRGGIFLMRGLCSLPRPIGKKNRLRKGKDRKCVRRRR